MGFRVIRGACKKGRPWKASWFWFPVIALRESLLLRTGCRREALWVYTADFSRGDYPERLTAVRAFLAG